MCTLYYTFVMCVFVIGFGVADDYTRDNIGKTEFTAKRLKRHNHNRHSQENHHSSSHIEPDIQRHEPSSNGFQHHYDHQRNQNHLDHSGLGDRFQPTKSITRPNNNMDRLQHYSNEFNQQPAKNHHSFENPPHNHQPDFKSHDSQSRPPDRHEQSHAGQMNNDHHDHRGSESEMLEKPRSLHGQQFEDIPVVHHHHASHQENLQESETRNHGRTREDVHHHSHDNNQKLNNDKSDYLSSSHPQSHDPQRGKDTNKEVITERSLQGQLVHEENLQLHNPSTRDQNNTRSHNTTTVSQQETNHQQTTTTPTTTKHPTISTTQKSNTSPPHPHISNVVVVTVPDRACADGMTKDFAGACRAVYD